MPSTYTPIASVVLSATASQEYVDFTSIPQTYTDIIIVCNGYVVTSTSYWGFQFNSDINTNYSTSVSRGNGSTVTTVGYANSLMIYASNGNPINTVANADSMIAQVMNYTNTSVFKTMLIRDNNAGIEINMAAGLWRSTSAINAIRIYTPTRNRGAGSTLSLYGIKAA